MNPETLESAQEDQQLRFQKGVGASKAKLLAQTGIERIEDACYYPPRRYEDRRKFFDIQDLESGVVATLKVEVYAIGIKRVRGRLTIVEAKEIDSTGALKIIWFNMPYLAKQLQPGQKLILFGKVELKGHQLTMTHPEMERVDDEVELGVHAGRIVPVYPLVSGITQRWMREFIYRTVRDHAADLEESLPPKLIKAKGWPGIHEAIRTLHFPQDEADLAPAQQRLAFEELLILQLALAQRRAQIQSKRKPQKYVLKKGSLFDQMIERLPFGLTGDQKQVLDELFTDMLQPYPMQRLLQGDVGCGKTIVMILLMAVVVEAKGQVALMAPTELLAEQHFATISKYLGPLGISVTLLSQSVSAAERRVRQEAVANGEVSIAIGTHALMQDAIAFKSLSFVIVDEQHKFGVMQRAKLVAKGKAPDVLVVTATPIPRTLALSLYGDLDVSTIREMPPGRKPIKTHWVGETERQRVYRAIHKQIELGRQVFIVYPLVDEKEDSDLKSATKMSERLRVEFKEGKVGLLHGKMKPIDKETTMQAFARNEIQVLVSTIVVEVGLDVPNATLMVIEHPERFGLAQMHQLRGRIGRGPHPSACILIGGKGKEAGQNQRLKAFTQSNDGFKLAETDMEIRGPGELIGRRQSGWAPFRIADLVRDLTWLENARVEAHEIIKEDPELASPDYSVLRHRLNRFRKQAQH